MIYFITFQLLLCFQVGSDVHHKELIQEKYYGSIYLESGSRFGAGNVFFNSNANICKPDTVYIYNGSLGSEDCFNFIDSAECIINQQIKEYVPQFRLRPIIRDLNRNSLHPEKIKDIKFKIVKCSFRVCKEEKREIAFVNYCRNKNREPILKFHEAVVLYINCP